MTATLIKNWSSTAGSNNSASPNGWPEGMPPSGVNDSARQMMASIRDWYIDPCWIDLGYTYTYVSGTSFKISALDKTADFVVGRRLRAVGTGTGTIYGVIATSAFSTDTTVTITWDSGSLSNETLAISLGLPSLGKPIPYAALGLTGKIVLADMADLAQDQFIGRTTASTGVPQTATITAAARTVLDDTTTAAMRTTLGLVVGTDVGYINIPQNSKSAAYTTVLADAGEHILHPSADTTARTFTIDSNANVAYAIGTAITFVNQASAGVLTIAITSDTMRLAVDGTTGSRTLAANGIATALKITATEWIISGAGLT